MRIMLDTNVLISSLLFPNSKMNSMMNYIFQNHSLILSSYVIDELNHVVKRKFPNKIRVIDELLVRMGYELVYTPNEITDNMFSIRDLKDYPVLYTAIIENIDILITGDKDFSDICIEKPEILTPSEFYDKFIIGGI